MYTRNYNYALYAFSKKVQLDLLKISYNKTSPPEFRQMYLHFPFSGSKRKANLKRISQGREKNAACGELWESGSGLQEERSEKMIQHSSLSEY